jgi:hypothetical protein
MDRAATLLQGLRRQLEKWLDTIKRTTGATAVVLLPAPPGAFIHPGEFVLRVEWKTKSGETKSFEHYYTRGEVFGSSYGGNPLTWRVEKRACDHAREFMRQVLAFRGV